MSNELLWLIFLVVAVGNVVLFYYLWGRAGLYVVISYSIILCNIQVLKQVQLFGMNVTLGNILYASSFLATDILSEFYGRRDANRGVVIGFFVAIIMAIYMQIALAFAPNESDWVQGSMQSVFGLVPGVVAASLIAYLCSQFHDVFLYELIRRKTKGRHLWLRNNGSTLISQLIDTVVFTSIATAFGIFPWKNFLSICVFTYIIKAIVALCDTPFIYLARAIKPRTEV